MSTKDKFIKNQKIYQMDIYEVDIHKVANINPMHSEEDFLALKYSIEQIGQRNPILMFKGKLVDGRNRLKALKELYNETNNDRFKHIKFIKLSTTLSMEELEEIVISEEARRHERPIQKAIKALNYYLLKDKVVSMTECGKIFGVSKAMISEALKLRTVAGDVVLQKLFNGDRIQIEKIKPDGTTKKIWSESAKAISDYYAALLNKSDVKAYEHELHPAEMAYVDIVVTRISDILSKYGMKYLNNCIEKVNEGSGKESCDMVLIEKELGINK